MRISTTTTTTKPDNKALFRELLSVTATSNKSTTDSRVIPQAPPMPSRVLHKTDRRESNAAATVLRQLHRIVCNQAWSLRHVPEPIVKHRICVVNATSKGAKTSAATTKKNKPAVQCTSAERPFPFRHVEPVVKQSTVVGVREAWMRLSLRAIERREFELKANKQTRVVTTPVVGVRDAWLKLALRAITRQEFTLKPSKTRETHLCVVLHAVDNDAKNKKNKKIVLPTTPVQLNHVNTRVRTTPVVGVRDGWMRLSLRAIVRGEFELKHVPEPRVTCEIVVVTKNNKNNNDDDATKKNNAVVLRRNAELLTTIANSDAETAKDTFEAVRLFEALDEKARKLVVELLRL